MENSAESACEVDELKCTWFIPNKGNNHLCYKCAEIVDQPGVDVFGQVYNQWKNKECVCPNCSRSIAASRFAPHLEKCLGMGRNSSRIANRRYTPRGPPSWRSPQLEVSDPQQEVSDPQQEVPPAGGPPSRRSLTLMSDPQAAITQQKGKGTEYQCLSPGSQSSKRRFCCHSNSQTKNLTDKCRRKVSSGARWSI